MILKATLIWLLILVLAVINGTVRVTQLIPRLGDRMGHVISTITLCVLVFVVAWCSMGWIGPADTHAALMVGTLWLVMTLAFELLAGHFIFHSSWEVLFGDYNLLRGRIWILVLLVTFFAPLWVMLLGGAVQR